MTAMPEPQRPSRRRILVVDDEPDICEALDVFLSSEGYQVSTVESGAAAIEQVKRQAFDLVITDLRMPGMSGVEAVASLKRLHPDLAVIVVSGYVSDESDLRCRAEGVATIIRKPFHLDDLLNVIARALGAAHA